MCIQSVLNHLPPPRLFPTDTSQNAFGLQLVRVVAHTGFTQVESFGQLLAGDGRVLLDDVDHRFLGGEQFLMDSLMASLMDSGRLALGGLFTRLLVPLSICGLPLNQAIGQQPVAQLQTARDIPDKTVSSI